MIKKLFRFNGVNYSKIEGLEPVKIDRWQFWVYTDPLKMPTKRVFEYFAGLDSIRLGIIRRDLEAFVAASRAQFNRGNFSGAAGLLEHLSAFLDLYAVERNLLSLGNSFILMDGEDPKEPTAEHYHAKEAAVKQSDDVRAFFLSRAYGSLTGSNQHRKDFNILEYLSNPTVQKSDRTFSTLIQSYTSKPK